MPIVKHEIFQEYELGIWEVTEEVWELEQNILPYLNDTTNYVKFKNEKRKKEWLAARHLIREMTGYLPDIEYSAYGKPSISNNKLNLSISHSENMVVVMLSNVKKVGVDIENSTRNIDKIASRFLSDSEFNLIHNSNNKLSSMQLWCAKEAIFKIMDTHDVEFKDQISIKSFQNFDEYLTLNAEFVSNEKTTYLELISINFKHFTIVSTLL